MSAIVKDCVEDYIRKLLIVNDKHLMAFRRQAEGLDIPIIHPEVQRHIELLIKAQKIESILEIGTAVAYSAAVFALAMGEKGKVDTIERNFKMVSQAQENIKNLSLGSRIHLLVGDAQEVIGNLEGSYDMIFLDGAKGHYLHLLDDCLPLLKSGGLLISDNVLFKGMIASDELVIRRKITIVKRMRAYLQVISNHPKLLTSVLPLGDGLAISLKKPINGMKEEKHEKT